QSDLDKVSSADVRVLFVGNSHTRNHGLPNLVCEMVRFRHPEKAVYARVVDVAFLDDVAREPRCRQEIESRPWTGGVLQAERLSASGRHDYARAEGIDIAKRARARGAAAFFFSEWGLKSVAGHGTRIEAVYREMARASGARVVPVGRAWDLALTARP